MVSVRLWYNLLLPLLSALLYVPTASQTIPAIQEDAGFRMVSREEGEAVVWVAWELRRGLGSKPDCSHFVNMVYTRAGLDYEYASTDAIFEGIEFFRRVSEPQPGDLVAWKGHVGLVVDPDEHSFYSSVRSGFAIENYRSDYWTSRGPSRFYRYVTDENHSARLAAHLSTMHFMLPPTQSASASRLGPGTDQVLHGTNSRRHSANTITKPSAGDSEVSDVIFVSSNDKPSKEEIRQAVIHLADANGDRVFQLPALPSNRAVVVVEQITVNELDLRDLSGWAELEAQDKGLAASRSRQRDVNQTPTRWRLTLRHEEPGWMLLVPRDRIYLRREVATRVISASGRN
jgi:hypothetical protein